MEDQKLQIIEKLKAANNILVTVSTNPSVDQLSACIGLTLLLNKMNKHATAVFSGQVPQVIKFLNPEETIEKNTDSLRDFIIALDKAKADKLRYKVEDEVVKIFITPYKSSISEKDLIFSQGDFNVDVVVALGVHHQQELDEAITAHGRILHDAVVISVNNTPETDLGSIHWQDLAASGMSELVTSLATTMGAELLDQQIATALLTGIVSETDHFSNNKTTPQTMTVSAALLAAGANQQLVATELGHAAGAAPAAAAPEEQKADDGGPLKITHSNSDAKKAKQSKDSKAAVPRLVQPVPPELTAASEPKEAGAGKDSTGSGTPDAADQPSSIDDLLQQAEDDLVASSVVQLPEPAKQDREYIPKVEPLKPSHHEPAASESATPEPAAPAPQLPPVPTALPVAPVVPHTSPAPSLPPAPGNSLNDLEKAVGSPHVAPASASEPAPALASEPAPDPEVAVDSARKAVEDALKASPDDDSDPLQALNAVPVNIDLGHDNPPAAPVSAPPVADGLPGYIETPANVPLIQPTQPTAGPLPFNPAANEAAPLNMSPADQPFTMPLPPNGGLSVPPPQVISPTSAGLPPQGPPPPPVPPPMPPFPQG